MKTLLKTTVAALMLVLFNLVTINATWAQLEEATDFKVYKGKIIDSETKKPVVFATVNAVGTAISTVTNSEGHFSLKIRSSVSVESIKVSHIGYKSQTIALTAITDEDFVVRMSASLVPLSEVTVRPKDAEEMLRNMMANVEKNYSLKPNMMTAFYREAIKKRSNYIYISEAIVDIYKSAYNREFDDDLSKVFKGRKSMRAKDADTIMVKLQGGPSVSLLLDIIKNPYILFEENNFANYDLNFGDMKVIDDKPNFVIEFTQKYEFYRPLYNGKLYINAQTMALTAAEFSLNLYNIDLAARTFIKQKPAGLRFTPLSTNYFVTYKTDANGKYYFNYGRYELSFICDWKKRVFESKYAVMAEIAITDRAETNVARFPIRERIKTNEVFADKVEAFTDANFWGEYNVIEPDKSIDEALRKYGKWLKRSQNQQ
jgi:hypothetical protein